MGESANRAAWPPELVGEICKLADGPARPVLEEGVQEWADDYRRDLRERRLSNAPPGRPFPYPADLSDSYSTAPKQPSPMPGFVGCCAVLAAVHDQNCPRCAAMWPKPSDDSVDVGGYVAWRGMREAVSKKADPRYLQKILDFVRAELRNRGVLSSADKVEQGEGNGGEDATPKKAAVESGADRAAILKQMQPAGRKAYLAFQYAETMAERRLEDREAYDWLDENGIDTEKGDLGELTDYKLPAFHTWSRQLRNGRQPLGEQKYTRRKGRAAGKSIVGGHKIEYQRGSEK